MNLEQLRKKIDGLNAEIIALFSERLKVAKEIAFVKKEHNLPMTTLCAKKSSVEFCAILPKNTI